MEERKSSPKSYKTKESQLGNFNLLAEDAHLCLTTLSEKSLSWNTSGYDIQNAKSNPQTSLKILIHQKEPATNTLKSRLYTNGNFVYFVTNIFIQEPPTHCLCSKTKWMELTTENSFHLMALSTYIVLNTEHIYRKQSLS